MRLKFWKDRRKSLSIVNYQDMDGVRFTADSIGYSALSKPTTGVGALQQPIKDLYLKYKKPGGSSSVKKVFLRVTSNGLSVIPVDGSKGEVVHDLRNITHKEAVRFTLLSGNDKKMRAIFLPLEESRVPPNKDKSVFSVDKSYQFFKQINHPPLLAFVTRRPKGVKSLDCHVFVMETEEDALQLISLIDQMECGGGYDIDYIGDRPLESGFNRGQRNDVIRTEYGEYTVYTGSKFDLKDDYFRPREGPSPNMRPHSDISCRENQDQFGWGYCRSTSEDEGWKRGEDGQYGHEEQFLGPKRPASTYESSRKGYSYDRPNAIVQNRQGSSGSGEVRLNRSLIESSNRGAMVDENIERGQHFQAGRLSKSVRNPEAMPPKVAEKPHKFENLNRALPISSQSPQLQQPQSPLSPMESPRDIDSRRSPTSAYNSQQLPSGRSFHQPTRGPSFSMSNRENWNAGQKQTDVDDAPQQKPVAKVPPHLMTGVKVLPTDFSAVKLKTRSPKSSFDEDDHDYDNNLNMKAKVKSYREEEENQNRPFSYGESDETRPANYGTQQHIYRDENYTTRVHNFSQDYDEDRRYIEQFNDDFDVQKGQHYDSGVNRVSDIRSSQNRPSSMVFEPPRHHPGNERMSKQPYDMAGREPFGNYGGQPPPKKDAEIASMFTNLHVHRDPPFHYTQTDTNFEQSLGYYP